MAASVENRFKDHCNGKVKSTKAYRPWILMYYEICIDLVSVREREKYWKTGIGRERITTFIGGYLENASDLIVSPPM